MNNDNHVLLVNKIFKIRIIILIFGKFKFIINELKLLYVLYIRNKLIFNCMFVRTMKRRIITTSINKC